MKHNKNLLVLLSLVMLASCQDAGVDGSVNGTDPAYLSSETSASVLNPGSFEEKTLTADIQDDNYRNYYQIFVYSFADGNGDKIGDLKGIDDKLSYLHDLGYTGIWLTPIFSSSTYHKYDALDYFQIDPDFGTLDDLKKLVKDAHQLDMKVILDGVFNHCSNQSQIFTDSLVAHRNRLAGREYDEKADSLFRFFDTEEEAKAANCTYYLAGGNGFYYEANFDRGMPEFNFDSEYTYEYIQSIIDYYMADTIGVDGFRLDAVKYYDLNDVESNVRILNRITKMVKDNDPDGYVVGEDWEDAAQIASYYQSDADSFFWFPGRENMISNIPMNPIYKMNYLNGQKMMIEAANGHIPSPFLDNHDTARISHTTSSRITKFRLGLRETLTGTTFNYYGDEIGMSSSNAPSSGDYLDSNYRTHYYWDDETHAYETKDAPRAQAQPENYGDSKSQLADPNSILNYEKKANLWRNSVPGIARGNLIDSSPSDFEINDSNSTGLLIVDKEYQGKKLKLLYNCSSFEETTYSVPADYQPVSYLASDTSDSIRYEDGTLTLPLLSIVLLEQKGE